MAGMGRHRGRPASSSPAGGPSSRRTSTRRDFIRNCAALAAGGPVLDVLASSGDGPTVPDPGSPGVDVVQIQSRHVVLGYRTHSLILAEMLDNALRQLTGADTIADAWHSLLQPNDRIALKFNQSGALAIGTTATMAEVLVASLTAAGFPADRLVLMEVPGEVCNTLGVPLADRGWDEQKTDFGSGQDYLAKVLGQVDAIINVPFLKDHNIAGLTCCLKNLSHALVKHPAGFHENGCSPYVADIVAIPGIRSKLKLNIVNALRTVWRGGPQAILAHVEPVGALILGHEPLTTDAIALDLLDDVRRAMGSDSVTAEHGGIAYFDIAAARGLGTHERHRISVKKLSA